MAVNSPGQDQRMTGGITAPLFMPLAPKSGGLIILQDGHISYDEENDLLRVLSTSIIFCNIYMISLQST